MSSAPLYFQIKQEMLNRVAKIREIVGILDRLGLYGKPPDGMPYVDRAQNAVNDLKQRIVAGQSPYYYVTPAKAISEYKKI